MIYDKYTCNVDHTQLRRDYIGASDASAIMGVSPWDTALTLWETKMGLRPAKKINSAMSRGLFLEETARQYLNDHFCTIFSPKRIFNDSYPFLMASLDGISDDGIIVEIKCPGYIDHECAKKGMVPKKYIPQLQHILLVSGKDEMYYFSYEPNEPILIKVEKDAEYQKNLLKEETSFYKNMQDFTEPKKTERDVNERYDVAWRDAAFKYRALCSASAQINEQIEDARKLLLQLCEDKSNEGFGVKVTKSCRKGAIQYSKIPEIQHVDLENYRLKPYETWKISIIGDEHVEATE